MRKQVEQPRQRTLPTRGTRPILHTPNPPQRRNPHAFGEQSRLPDSRLSRQRQNARARRPARDPRGELSEDRRATGERCLPVGQGTPPLRQVENPSPKRGSCPHRLLVGPPLDPILIDQAERLATAARNGERLRER